MFQVQFRGRNFPVNHTYLPITSLPRSAHSACGKYFHRTTTNLSTPFDLLLHHPDSTSSLVNVPGSIEVSLDASTMIFFWELKVLSDFCSCLSVFFTMEAHSTPAQLDCCEGGQPPTGFLFSGGISAWSGGVAPGKSAGSQTGICGTAFRRSHTPQDPFGIGLPGDTAG